MQPSPHLEHGEEALLVALELAVLPHQAQQVVGAELGLCRGHVVGGIQGIHCFGSRLAAHLHKWRRGRRACTGEAAGMRQNAPYWAGRPAAASLLYISFSEMRDCRRELGVGQGGQSFRMAV